MVRSIQEQAVSSPNLFDFATKELSQDAVICWLIAWAGAETNGKLPEEELRLCGRALLEALFSKWRDRGDIELGDEVRAKILHQERNIDVLARINGLGGQYVLLIEDKTNTRAHDDQLAKYLKTVTEGKTGLGRVDEDRIFPIYCKTGNHSLRDRQYANENGYRVFDRSDFLGVLKTYHGGNEILLDFRSHLEQWERDTHSFRRWTSDGERTSRGWEGFYRWVEDNCLGGIRDSWGPLGSLVGGYEGVWIEPTEMSKTSRFAIWLEKDRISFRLYGAKRKRSVTGMNRDKNFWARTFDKGGGGRFAQPRRLVATRTKPMCVAEWRGWVAFSDNGKLDLEQTAKNLNVARRTLRRAIKDSPR